MADADTLHRAEKYGIRNILTSKYLIIPLVAGMIFYFAARGTLDQEEIDIFVSAATGVSQSLIAVTLTGLAILVSFSDSDFLSYFLENGGFDELLFIFEYTVLWSILTTVFGIFLQAFSFERWVFFGFVILFLHLLASVAALVATILRYASTRADYERQERLKEMDIPDELKEDVQRMVEEDSDSEQSEE